MNGLQNLLRRGGKSCELHYSKCDAGSGATGVKRRRQCGRYLQSWALHFARTILTGPALPVAAVRGSAAPAISFRPCFWIGTRCFATTYSRVTPIHRFFGRAKPQTSKNCCVQTGPDVLPWAVRKL